MAIRVGQLRGVFDDFGHRAADKVEIGCLPVLEEGHYVVVAPFSDPGFRIRGDFRDSLAVRTVGRTGEKARRLGGAEPIARRVAFTAMGERGDKIGAAIVSLATLGRRTERARTEKEQLPPVLQETPRKGKATSCARLDCFAAGWVKR